MLRVKTIVVWMLLLLMTYVSHMFGISKCVGLGHSKVDAVMSFSEFFFLNPVLVFKVLRLSLKLG